MTDTFQSRFTYDDAMKMNFGTNEERLEVLRSRYPSIYGKVRAMDVAEAGGVMEDIMKDMDEDTTA